MSIQAMVWAIETRCGSDRDLKVLLMTLANYANTDDQTWHCQDKISYDTEIPVRTLRRKMQELVEMGLISVDERRRPDGTKTSSMITVLRHPAAMVAGGDLADGTTGQKGGAPAATKVAGHRLVKNRKEDSSYSEEFEALWQAYPRTKNTSKSGAWNVYRMLNVERQEMVRRAVPLYAAAMRAEGRPENLIKHMVAWLNGRFYETASAPESAPASSAGPAKPFWEIATRKQWGNALLAWSSNWVWSKSWGPEPGQPGCHVPQDILDRFDLKYRGHLFSPEHMAEIRGRVSKQAVDSQPAAVA